MTEDQGGIEETNKEGEHNEDEDQEQSDLQKVNIISENKRFRCVD